MLDNELPSLSEIEESIKDLFADWNDNRADKRADSKPKTIDHRVLQLYGQKWLYDYGCKYAATEVPNKFAKVDYFCGFLDEELMQVSTQPSNNSPRYIFDVLGLKPDGSKWEIIGIEVKVSKSDLAKGFCTSGCHRIYVLVPEELAHYKYPIGVGLLVYKDGEIVCKRGAKKKSTSADPEYLLRKILERNSNQIKFMFLRLALEVFGRGREGSEQL
jgi:hypothetical protein